MSVGFYGQNNGCGIILLLFDNIPTSHFSSKCVNVVVGICSDLRFVKNIYTTRFSGQNFCTLKMRKLRLFFTQKETV